MSDSDDDDKPQLSAAALAALQEYYAERENEAGQLSALTDKYTVGALKEDWSMSQFWYSDETATRLAEEAMEQAGEHGRIACVSAPSVYQKLKQLESERKDATRRVSAVLLEFDRRFGAFGEDFVFYDYSNPLCVSEAVQPHSFDIVVADPPYLAEECLSKVALTVKYLTKGKILLCTGAIMEELAGKLMGLKICAFLPKHSHNLANEFRCYVNYESSLLT